MSRIRLWILAGLAAVGTFAEQPPTRASMVQPSDSSNLPLQKLGRDDLVGVTVYDAPEFTRTVRVGADGTIRLPMLKARVHAAGLLPTDLEATIAAALSKEDLMVDPVVSVSVIEYRSRPISVVGAVRHPLTFQAAGSLTLLDAISRAEGLSESAGPEVLVSRRQPAGPDGKIATLVQRVTVARLIDAADPEVNVPLEGGEEIRVPEAGRVYVVGNVKKSGAFPMKDGGETSLLKVLALSEGLMPYAANTAFIYRQEGGSGGRNEIAVELKKIIERRALDVPLLANDIVYIPDNKSRRTTMSALEKLLLFGGGASAALIYTLAR